jgi:hypothetical protein
MASGRARGAPSSYGRRMVARTGSAVSRAYNRSDTLERRRPVMDEWAAFLAGEAEAAAKASVSSAKVVSIGSRQKRP